MLTSAVLRSLLSYSPETGEFHWLKSGPGRSLGIPAGGIHAHGYVTISVNRRVYGAHRLAWLYMTGSWPEAEIDHINRNRADNRFANLRPATSTEQKWNASLSKRNRSGVKGVCWATQAGKWQAAIRASGSRRLLGMFDRFEDAKAAREQAEIKLFGSFSALAEIGPSAP